MTTFIRPNYTTRRWAAGLCAVVLALSLTGCGRGEDDVTVPPAVKTPAPATVAQSTENKPPAAGELVIPKRDPFEPPAGAPEVRDME